MVFADVEAELGRGVWANIGEPAVLIDANRRRTGRLNRCVCIAGIIDASDLALPSVSRVVGTYTR